MDEPPQSSDERAKSTDERGQSLDERGKSADERPQSVDEREKSAEERGQSLDQRVKSTDERAESVDQRGQSLGERGKSTDERPKSIDERGKSTDERTQSLDQRGKSTDERPKSIDDRPNTMDERGQSIPERKSTDQRTSRAASSPESEKRPSQFPRETDSLVPKTLVEQLVDDAIVEGDTKNNEDYVNKRESRKQSVERKSKIPSVVSENVPGSIVDKLVEDAADAGDRKTTKPLISPGSKRGSSIPGSEGRSASQTITPRSKESMQPKLSEGADKRMTQLSGSRPPGSLKPKGTMVSIAPTEAAIAEEPRSSAQSEREIYPSIDRSSGKRSQGTSAPRAGSLMPETEWSPREGTSMDDEYRKSTYYDGKKSQGTYAPRPDSLMPERDEYGSPSPRMTQDEWERPSYSGKKSQGTYAPRAESLMPERDRKKSSRGGFLSPEDIAALTNRLKTSEELIDKLTGIVEDNQKQIDDLTNVIDYLKTIKADREDVAEAMAEKADVCNIQRKVSQSEFQETVEDISKNLETAIEKLFDQELMWQQALNEFHGDLKNKLDKMDLDPLRKFINKKIRLLHGKIKALSGLNMEIDAAGTKNRYLKDVNCLSCDRKVFMCKELEPRLRAPHPCVPPSRSLAPYLAYELDTLRRKKVPFTKNVNYIENALYMGRGLKTDGRFVNRFCGGSHTITTPQQRVVRLGHFLNQWGPKALIQPHESKFSQARSSIVVAKESMIRRQSEMQPSLVKIGSLESITSRGSRAMSQRGSRYVSMSGRKRTSSGELRRGSQLSRDRLHSIRQKAVSIVPEPPEIIDELPSQMERDMWAEEDRMGQGEEEFAGPQFVENEPFIDEQIDVKRSSRGSKTASITSRKGTNAEAEVQRRSRGSKVGSLVPQAEDKEGGRRESKGSKPASIVLQPEAETEIKEALGSKLPSVTAPEEPEAETETKRASAKEPEGEVRRGSKLSKASIISQQELETIPENPESKKESAADEDLKAPPPTAEDEPT